MLQVTGWDISPSYRSLIIKTVTPSLNPAAQQAIETAGFNLKSETHITVVGSSVGKDLSDTQFGQIRVAMREFSFDDVELVDDVYRVAKPKVVDGKALERESLIAPISSVAIGQLVQKLSHQLYISLDPYLHVTVATRPDTAIAQRGISIASRQEFDEINQGEFFTARP